jgi:hypothetical protein
MAKQTINIGVAANDGLGDNLRTSFDKTNDNFDEIYLAGPVSSNIQITTNVIASTNTDGNITLDPAGTGNTLINSPLQLQSLTTTERNALTAVNGMLIYNETDNKIQARAGGSWVNLH